MEPVKPPVFSVRRSEWVEESAAMRSIRTAVFVMEQQVPEDEEWDDMDPLCVHALAVDARGTVIGTGRLAPDGKIGRMAVLKGRRGQGVGTALLQFLVQAARAGGHAECHMNAQSHALPFYARHGFQVYGEEFMEAGIPHRCMRLRF
jgi:predicted GNAT family N-acyltransferase